MLRDVLKSDLKRYLNGIGFKAFLKAWRSPCFRFLFFFRNVTSSKKYSLKWIFSFVFYRKYFLKYGIQIPTSAKIGKGLLLPHFGGIVINSGTIIGENCTILQNVTLGNTKGGRSPGSPKVGNKVYVGPGSVIVGNINIGDNVLIAGNSFVNIDIPAHSIVIGNPANVISKNNPTKDYIE